MDFDAHSLKVLEYDTIIALLAERTACALGRERAGDLTPSPVAAFVRERQQETAEARLLLSAFGPLPLSGIHDVRPLLVRAEVAQNLTPSELLDLSSTLIGAVRLKQHLQRHAEKAPLLADRAQAIQEFPPLLREIEMCIGRNGEVLDSASSNLGSIRSRLKVLEQRVNERLNQFLSSSNYRSMLMDPVIVLRDDRRCLPVRAEYKNQIRGIVHDQSTSGATFFIEPMAVVEINNQIREEEIKERVEIDRVLRRLTELVAKQGTRIHSTVEVVAGLDLANAKAKLADEMNAVEPSFNQRGYIRLREARHPLINPDDVVPISLQFGDKTRCLLITGPNTGGKTVTLKTVALFTLMAQAGLQIPAETGTELALFDQVFADIGDEQSIAQSLSTFSAHITNIVRILKSVGMRALVVMDEVGAGTDPAEGAALAKAILAYLMTHNARIIATSHYGELKEYAYVADGIENVAVEFDMETLKPTYRLLQGVPGSSQAFHIARRLGMPNRVVDEAVEFVGKSDMEAGELMRRLEGSKRVADEERRKAERMARELEDLKHKYEARLRDLETLRREAKERATEEARVLIRRNTEKMENIIGELRRLGKEGRKTQSARKKMKDVADELIGGIGYEKEPLPPTESDAPEKLRKGDRVQVLSLGGMAGEVLADSEGGEVTVQVGAIRVTVPLSALRVEKRAASASFATTGGGGAKPATKQGPVAGERGGSATALAMEKAANIEGELSLIAQRVDAALPRLDKYLDDAYAAGLQSVRIIHGKGTGQLRKAIWDFLKEDERVASYQLDHPDNGGAGATVIRFQS
ncbi:MAG: endonuclease MutS2 [Armatimonadaceae bacterium]